MSPLIKGEWRLMDSFSASNILDTTPVPGSVPRKALYFSPIVPQGPIPAVTEQEKIAYTCSQCGKVYQYLHNLKKHQRMECGKDPQFACPHCPHRSYAKWNLNKHIQSRHQGLSVQ
ncbi:zinc finger Y-chromosomal protein 2 [Frankliniella occidentalis]|uniref:Zinc finger Y-chromosomal protein 2 n=1 Tax=Frankliniella occidentalis TaxID=133901 RepID=A0A6J1TKY3_FRAOC|nr:zinc finger Y-chromosomal protein 2 [Frankliniella occidentalis]